MPTPISISSSARVKMGLPLAGGVQPVRATPMVRVTSTTRLPRASRSSRLRPRSAAAPTAFMTKKLPATPRRPTVQVESLTATSSLMTTVRTSIPSASAISRPVSNDMVSPV